MASHSKKNLEHALGEEWWQCCWLLKVPEWATAIGNAVSVYFDPMIFTTLLETLIIANIGLRPPDFEAIDGFLSRLHNLLVIPMNVICGLYLVFKQRRPGRYDKSHNFRPYGSIYGMPSGDAMFAAMVGAAVFANHPLFAIFVSISVAASRVVRGFHSILQVFVGALFGVVFVLMCNEYPLEGQVAVWLAGILLPGLMLFDENVTREAKLGGPNNLYSWWLFGVSTTVFDLVVCAPAELDMFYLIDRNMKMTVGFIVRFVMHMVVGYMINEKPKSE
jgi:membrane-associated phospholipid phosphatase